jgi:hypothetical protein
LAQAAQEAQHHRQTVQLVLIRCFPQLLPLVVVVVVEMIEPV